MHPTHPLNVLADMVSATSMSRGLERVPSPSSLAAPWKPTAKEKAMSGEIHEKIVQNMFEDAADV